MQFIMCVSFDSIKTINWNAARVCILRSGVKKNASISSFFYGQRWTKCAVNILRSYLNWWHNWQLKSRRRSHTLKDSHSMGDRRNFLKTRRNVSFNKVLSNEPLSAGSISLDSTFNVLQMMFVALRKHEHLICHSTDVTGIMLRDQSWALRR